eukprot:2927966-Rhodomonas_salina.1
MKPHSTVPNRLSPLGAAHQRTSATNAPQPQCGCSGSNRGDAARGSWRRDAKDCGRGEDGGESGCGSHSTVRGKSQSLIRSSAHRCLRAAHVTRSAEKEGEDASEGK